MLRFWIVVLIAVLAAAGASGYLGLNRFPTVVICLATAFAVALVQKVILPISNGHDPFGSHEGQGDT